MEDPTHVRLDQLPLDHPLLRFKVVHIHLMHGMGAVHNLLSIGWLGLAHAHARTPFPGGDVPEVFDDPDVMSLQVEQGEACITASALILAYTVASELITTLCTISLVCDRPAWVQFVQNNKLRIADVVNGSTDRIVDEALQASLYDLERHSLEEKTTRLLKVLCPGNVATVVDGYTYSRERIAGLTELRTKCVHGFRFTTRIAEVQTQIGYLTNTVRFFGRLMQKKYRLFTGNPQLDEWQ